MHHPPLARHVLFSTTDPDCARQRVGEKFCDHRLDVIGERAAFRAAHHHLAGSMLSLNYISYGSDVLIDPGSLDNFYLIQIPIHGAATIRNGKREVESHLGAASVLNPHWATRMKWWAGCAQVLVQIRRDPFLAYAEQFIGRTLERPITFEPLVDVTRPELARWRHAILSFVAHAETGQGVTPLTQKLCEQELLADFLRLQPHDMSDFLDEPPVLPLTRHLRRAMEFIRENAAQPLTIAEIASAADLGVRALQMSWKATFGGTPMEALARERLRRVRRELRAGGRNACIADTARKWGFAHVGRFSSAYRNQFGELPRQTVQNLT